MPTIEERYIQAKRKLFDQVYASLNDRQREAVFTVNGPLLVLAGAGSGKTTVLVRRIGVLIKYGNAYLSEYVPYGTDEEQIAKLEKAVGLPEKEIEENILPEFANQPCEPYRILAITFTNKAANEIKERIGKMFPNDPAIVNDIWAGTFHSICVRILRRHGDLRGYKPGFTIYDTDDTKKAMLAAMKNCNIDEKLMPVKSVMNAISRAKDKLLTPDAFAAEAGDDYRQKQVAKIYESYQALLRESNALDFDDIIMQTVLLFRQHEDVLDAYRKRFRYVCVDEYQDTNVAQMELTVLLASGHNNLMVVGDDDQSIYRFRGATVENILTFDRLFPTAKVIKLEQNYRSTQTILDAANKVIANNMGRHEKKLWTAGDEGEKIRLTLCEDQNTEARYLVDCVSRAVADKTAAYRDFAILYRTNAQSQSIEKAFARSAIPYRILGGTRFSDRKEIRDAVAYLQLINNHADNLRLARIINEPKRKIGERTMETVAEIAEELGISQFEVMERASEFTALERSKSLLESFAATIDSLTAALENTSLDAFFDMVLDRTGYRQMLIDNGQEDAERLENLDEFKSGIIEYLKENEEPTLTGFLEETALVADVDRYDESADAVVMMTIHSAKGLEFPHVFLPGMEDGLFPGMQTICSGDNVEMEEERRLAYVAITRAKKTLCMTHTRTRLLYGQTSYNSLSRFVQEIPESLLEKEDRTDFSGAFTSRSSFGGSRGWEAPVGQVRTYYSESVSMPVKKSRKQDEDNFTVGKTVFRQNVGSKGTFSAGDRVKHPTFGEGTVLSVKAMGPDNLYEVMFDTAGTKKLMGSYAKLSKL